MQQQVHKISFNSNFKWTVLTKNLTIYPDGHYDLRC